MPGTNTDVRGLGGFVWSIAEILRGDFKQSEYGKVILPFIVLRRLDCLLDASKRDVLEAAKGLSDAVDDPTRDMILVRRCRREHQGLQPQRLHVRKPEGSGPRPTARQPDRLHHQVLRQCPRHLPRQVSLHRTTEASQRGRHPLAGFRPLHADRLTPRTGRQHRDGLPVRGFDPAVLGNLQRNGGRGISRRARSSASSSSCSSPTTTPS